ncbi:hypothetical protein TNCV_4409311 [Trichonephila clavipes]|nr:hypothetical protein TNCV_4409311 [Trichonephila clavipes]
MKYLLDGNPIYCTFTHNRKYGRHNKERKNNVSQLRKFLVEDKRQSNFPQIPSAVCQAPDTVLIRVESMIDSTTKSSEFRSKDGTLIGIPDADFNIIHRSVTKIPLPALPLSKRLPSV